VAVLAAGLVLAGCGTPSSSSSHGMAGMDMSGMSMDMTSTGSGTTSYWNQVQGGAAPAKGRVRTYHVSADVVPWNYAPSGKDQITGQPFGHDEAPYVVEGNGRIGATYLKCLYRGYADAGFHAPQQRPAADAYLGNLGPVLRAEVGDTIRVVYRNTCPFPTSMHPHGVFYDKASEGAPYQDGTSGGQKDDDAVPTGGTHTYSWRVPDRAGPGPADGSSVMWMYHSHTDEVGDLYAGLTGMIVVTRAGMARPDGSPEDVDREVFLDFMVDNESKSPLLADNQEEAGVPVESEDQESEEIAESNLKHGINGYLYGNMPMIDVKAGQHVRWYVMGMGTEVDLHTPHWHGNDVTVNGMRTDVVSLLPATMVIADMVPDDVGTWLLHCHVNDHIAAGMVTRYRVTA
jgi:FtsP/CotA-like multicopper oxidase with cupredoxin domain